MSLTIANQLPTAIAIQINRKLLVCLPSYNVPLTVTAFRLDTDWGPRVSIMSRMSNQKSLTGTSATISFQFIAGRSFTPLSICLWPSCPLFLFMSGGNSCQLPELKDCSSETSSFSLSSFSLFNWQIGSQINYAENSIDFLWCHGMENW